MCSAFPLDQAALQLQSALDIFWIYTEGTEMSKSSQHRAIANFRNRLAAKGLVRFEVTGRDSDRELVRNVARRLAEGGPDSDRLRAAVRYNIGGESPRKGEILKALLASPLIGSELDLTRPREEGRGIDI